MISSDNLSPAPSPQPKPQLQIQPINGGVRNVVTDLISSNLSSRIIPKIGSIVKRFSLNYSGEGLVTDRQRVRTVRVGIKFQVQVDSFVNNQRGGNRPRGITRTNSLPPESIEFYNQHSNSPNKIDICDPIAQRNNRALCGSRSPSISSSNVNSKPSITYSEVSPKTSPTFEKTYSTDPNLNNSEVSELDSSSGVSSLAGSASHSPVASRRHSSSLAFHNRINQALTLYRSQLAAAAASRRGTETDFTARRASVQVLRRGSVTPDRTSSGYYSPPETSPPSEIMEDASSYQVLRYFPGKFISHIM
jgi:hypothetical protein